MANLSKEEYERRTEILLRSWATQSSYEIEQETGIPKSWLIKNARKRGLKHTEETTRRLKLKSHLNWHIDREALSQKKKRMFRMDVFRVMSGMKPLGNIPVYLTPKITRRAMYKLARRGYWFDNVDDRKLYYNEETNRTKWEAYHTRKHRIVFIDASTPIETERRAVADTPDGKLNLL